VVVTHEREHHEPNLEFGGAFGPGPRETVADLLRHAREDFGQDLRSVAEVLRIRPVYLEAIESGDFDQLPGTTYAIGFLRTYAEYLGLNGEDMVERFKAETQAAARRSELVFPEPVAEGRIPGGAIILVSVVLLAVAYGGWFYLSQQGTTVADIIPAWPSETQTAKSDDGATPAATPAPRLTDPVAPPAGDTGLITTATAQAGTEPAAAPPAPNAPVQTAASPTASESPVPTPPAPSPGAMPDVAAPPPPAAMAPAGRAPAPPQAVADTRPSAGETTRLSALVDRTVVIPAPPSTPETVVIPDDRSPRVYGGSNDDSRIVIRAVQDSWVQVRDKQEAILLTRVLRAGDSYRVPDVAGLTLLTGNAGGIELEVDGVRLPPAGPPGAVRRSISLDPAQLLGGASANR
jgi:cytoskeletal protein RodZ